MAGNNMQTNLQPERTFLAGKLQVEVFADRAALGRAAAVQAATTLKQAMARQGLMLMVMRRFREMARFRNLQPAAGCQLPNL